MKNWLRIIIILLSCQILYLCFSSTLVIEIKSMNQNEVIFRKVVSPGFSFTTVICHSVHLTPVYEYYVVDKNGKIILSGTKLKDFGWGVPSTFQQEMRFSDGYFIIEDIGKNIPMIPFRVSYIASPRLLLDNYNKEIDLTKVVNDLDRIDITVKKMNSLTLYFRGEVDDFSK